MEQVPRQCKAVMLRLLKLVTTILLLQLSKSLVHGPIQQQLDPGIRILASTLTVRSLLKTDYSSWC